MIETIGVALSSLSGAVDLAKGLNATVTDSRIAEVKLDLIGRLMEAKEALLTAKEEKTAIEKRIDALEAEIVKLKDWSAEADRYELADCGQGTLAYRQKATVEEGQPGHWLCPTCFQERKKAILQPEKFYTQSYLRCFTCKTDLITRGVRTADEIKARR